MKVLMIDGMGTSRYMDVEHLPVRVPKRSHLLPLVCNDSADMTQITYEVVDFKDSNLVDQYGLTVLTPDGQDVPLGKYPYPVYRRARRLWADVFLSDAERYSMRAKVRDVVWDLAFGHMRSMCERTARLMPLDVCEIPENRQPGASCFRVFAEEQVPVTTVDVR